MDPDQTRARASSEDMDHELGDLAMLHTIYAARYARIYQQGAPTGIDFNSEVPSRYLVQPRHDVSGVR
ncbi:hypothetical protein HNP40_003363 [Mycobacteroides chelonae]|nr:hypothetical protein [Mycobacteroides chelonae]